MSQTHLHLFITHLPIFGSILGGLVLAYGILSKVSHTQVAAYFVLMVSSTGAVIAYMTGEAAEETVEKIRGVSENLIEQHEEFAVVALISFLILGVASIASLIINRRKASYTRPAAVVVLVIALVSFGLAVRTGLLGGRIRHTEIHSQQVIQELEQEQYRGEESGID